MATANNILDRASVVLLGVIAVAAVAVAVVLAIHGHAHASTLPATTTLTTHQLRQLAIPPIHPLPGATPAEWATYLHAKASFCALQPQAAICS